MSIPIQPRRNTAALAAVSNPVLLMGELGLETDTGKTKRGNGVTAWNLLPYLIDTAAANSTYALVLSALDARVGMVLDGATDNGAGGTNALAKAYTILGARGGTIFVPAGIAEFDTAPGVPVPSNVRIVGAGKNATILRRTYSGAPLLDFSGASSAARCQRGGLADLMIHGNTNTTGPLVRAVYADHLNFDRVWWYGAFGGAFVGTELWDTYFSGCEFEWVGAGTTGLEPAVLLSSSATDSTNQIFFEQCRWESFRDSALVIASAGVSGAFTAATGPNPVYGVYLTDCKMESAFLRGPVINYSADVSDIHVTRLYLAADNVDTGIASGRDLIAFNPTGFCTFNGVHVFINNNSTARVFRLFPGPVGHSIQDIYVNAVTLPSVAVVDFAGGNPTMTLRNIRFKTGQAGVLYSGTVPSNVTLADLPTVRATTQAAAYTLALANADGVVEMTSATGVALTVPSNSSTAFPIGTIIEVQQYGAGQVTLTPGAGVTLRTATSLTTRAIYSTVSLRKRATDEWVVSGDLT